MMKWFGTVAWCFTAAALVPALAYAEPAPADSGASTRRSSWRVIPVIETTIEGDNNVFLLSPSRKDNLTAISAAEAASARYTDMESASDFAATLDAALAFRGRGAAGRRLEIVPEARYERYASNPRRSSGRFGLAIEQALPSAGQVRLSGHFTPASFAKNYLADAVDLDGSLTITPDERRYRPGTYSESESRLAWRFRLARRKEPQPVGAALELGAGYFQRAFDAPFEDRDLAGPMFSILVDLDTGARTAFELEYEVEILGADPSPEVLLLDESDFGVDFNGNANATDLSVRALQTVDRSRTEHAVTATLRVETSPGTVLKCFGGWRARSFASDQPYDIGNRDRHDRRVELGASVRVRVHPDASFTLGGEYGGQSTNRAGDPGSTGDVDDYRRGVAFAALTYRR